MAVYASAALAWELTTKYRNGRLQDAADIALNLPAYVRQWHFEPLPITVEHSHRAGLLPGAHRDPFDRMLAAQANMEGLELATVDPALAGLGAKVVW